MPNAVYHPAQAQKDTCWHAERTHTRPLLKQWERMSTENVIQAADIMYLAAQLPTTPDHVRHARLLTNSPGACVSTPVTDQRLSQTGILGDTPLLRTSCSAIGAHGVLCCADKHTLLCVSSHTVEELPQPTMMGTPRPPVQSTWPQLGSPLPMGPHIISPSHAHHIATAVKMQKSCTAPQWACAGDTSAADTAQVL